MADVSGGRVVHDFLPAETFEAIVDAAPLVSIDLVVRDQNGLVLLGRRNNRPAQGYWFVPGGRIRKNESLESAFTRLTKDEIGIESEICSATYLGLYEHFYDDSIFTEAGKLVSTHYVVNGFEIVVDSADMSLPEQQHNDYCWQSEAELLTNPEVHIHSKWYFQKDKGFL